MEGWHNAEVSHTWTLLGRRIPRGPFSAFWPLSCVASGLGVPSVGKPCTDSSPLVVSDCLRRRVRVCVLFSFVFLFRGRSAFAFQTCNGGWNPCKASMFYLLGLLAMRHP